MGQSIRYASKKNYITWRPTNKSLIWNSRCRAKKILEYFVEVSLYPSITFMSPNHDAVKIEKLNENLDLESRFLIRWISWSDVFKVDAYIVQHNSSVELRLGSNRLRTGSICRYVCSDISTHNTRWANRLPWWTPAWRPAVRHFENRKILSGP